MECPWPQVDGAERIIKEEHWNVSINMRSGGRKRKEKTSSFHSAENNRRKTNMKIKRHKVHSATDEGMEAFSFLIGTIEDILWQMI